MIKGLCYRCEYRASYHETGRHPRLECANNNSVISCYMYLPVKPLIVKRNKEDNRPLFPPAISARTQIVNLAKDIECTYRKTKRGYLFYWIPKDK